MRKLSLSGVETELIKPCQAEDGCCYIIHGHYGVTIVVKVLNQKLLQALGCIHCWSWTDNSDQPSLLLEKIAVQP